MEVRVSVEGEGTVKGGGTYNVGDKVELTATPVGGNAFLHWVRNNITVKDNPYIFTTNGDNVDLVAIFYTTIESYLRACVGFIVPDAALTKIRVDRGIKLNEDIKNVTIEQRELCYADLLMWGANAPSQIQGAKSSDFGWSSQEASSTMSITDKRLMRSDAREIYRRYGDKRVQATVMFTSITGDKLNGSKY